jgi:hypothetical protein
MAAAAPLTNPQQLSEEIWLWVYIAFQSISSIRALYLLYNTLYSFAPVETLNSGYY